MDVRVRRDPPRVTLPRRVALCAGAVVALLPVSAARAQSSDALPFVPLPTSAECSTGEPRNVDISVAGSPHVVVTARNRVSRGRAQGSPDLHARTLGRSLQQPKRRSLPIGNVVDRARDRYVAAKTRRGDVIYRISGNRSRVHVLQVASMSRDATGPAVWLPILHADRRFLDRAALVSRATTWSNAGDLALDGDTLYVALPNEHRVVAVALDEGTDRWGRTRAEVWNYIEAGANAPWAFAPPTSEDSFTFPTELGVDRDGYLYVAEDVDGAALKARGDDIWVAAPASDEQTHSPAVARFASLEHCDAEVTGLHLEPGGAIYLRIARSRSFFGLALKN